MIWRWEFCHGRYQQPSGGYYRGCQARGFCPVCGYDCALISGGRVRHHFREISRSAVGVSTPEDTK